MPRTTLISVQMCRYWNHRVLAVTICTRVFEYVQLRTLGFKRVVCLLFIVVLFLSFGSPLWIKMYEMCKDVHYWSLMPTTHKRGWLVFFAYGYFFPHFITVFLRNITTKANTCSCTLAWLDKCKYYNTVASCENHSALQSTDKLSKIQQIPK